MCVCGGGGVEGGGYIFVGGQGGLRLHFVGRGVMGVLWGWGVSNCTVKQATQQGCLKNQQSKVLSVLPTVMANSSIASQRGGDRSRQILQWIGKGPRG